MTTFVDFAPPPGSPSRFEVTLDDQLYSAVVTWGLFGQRWYLELYTLEGERVLTRAVVGSDIGVSTRSVEWSGVSGLVVVRTSDPHRFGDLGTEVELVLTGIKPEAYNGRHRMLVTGADALTYPWTTDPDPFSEEPGSGATQQGTLSHDVNLVAGYFKKSTLLYRTSTRRFEVYP